LDAETVSERWLWPHDVSALFAAAGLYAVDAKALRRYVKAGKVTAIRTLGGHRRYRESEALALIAELKTAACCRAVALPEGR
jgi:predicted site-specific integrase-resolvase